MQFLARFVHCWPLLFVGRYVSQLSTGVVWGTLPVLLNEFSTVELRGSLGLTFGFFANFAALLSTVIGLESVLGTHDRWPYIFLYLLIHTMIGLLLLVFVYHESPAYAVDAEERAASYQFYQRSLLNYDENLENDVVKGRSYDLCNPMRLLCHGHREVRKAALVSFALTATRIFCCIDIIQTYSTTVFSNLGFSSTTSQYLSVGLTVTSIVGGLICYSIVDRIRRRKIIIISGTLIVICFASIIIFSFFSSHFAACFVYALAFLQSISVQPLWYVMVSELFHLRYRVRGKAMALQMLEIMIVFVLLCFYILLTKIHSFVFLFFMIPLAGFLLYLYFKLPETKGRTEEEIVALLSLSE